MKPEDYPANWEDSGKGLGAQPPGNLEIPEPARGTPELQAIEPDTGGVPPQGLGPSNNQPSSPPSAPTDSILIQAVTVSGGGTSTEEINVVIIP